MGREGFPGKCVCEETGTELKYSVLVSCEYPMVVVFSELRFPSASELERAHNIYVCRAIASSSVYLIILYVCVHILYF